MTTTNKIKVALIGLIPTLGFALLPSDVISHFDSAGVADDTLPRGVLIVIFTVISTLMVFGTTFISRIIPPSIDARVGLLLNYYGLCFGVWMLLMWILVIVAKSHGNGQISIIGIWLASVVLVAPLGLLLLPSEKSKTNA